MAIATWGMTAVLLVATASAAAAWVFEEDRDPITDQRVGYIEQPDGAGAVRFSLGVKCWRDNPGATMLLLISARPHVSPANGTDLRAVIRVDGGTPQPFLIGARDFGGTTIYGITFAEEPLVAPILEAIRTAQRRIALSVDGMTLSFPADGSRAAVDQFRATCVDP